MNQTQTKGYCNQCHYSCLNCSGPTNTDCTVCHEDSSPVWTGFFGESSCVLNSIAPKIQAMVWFYRCTILLSIVLTCIIVCFFINWFWDKKHSLCYGYSKVTDSNSQDSEKLIKPLEENVCATDSE